MTASTVKLAPKHRKHHAGLIFIAAYKLLDAVAFIAIGVGALKLVHKNIDDVVWYALIEVLHRNPESHFVNFIFEKAELLNDPMLKRIGLGAFCYAALHILEAIGLYLEKIWGEVLTTLITASFLPFEIHEVFRRVTWLRCGILAINILVLGYILWVLAQRATARARERRFREVES